MNWNLDELAGKDIIMTGENRDMTETRRFLEQHARAKSYRHVYVDLTSDVPVVEQLGNPDLATSVIIKAPGVPGRLMTVPYVTSAQLFFKLIAQLEATIIGVTGTKGKTTTSTLLNAMLEQGGKHTVLCGNIGTSFLTLLEGTSAETIFVAELSSYMLEDLTVSPHIGIVTNLYHDHIDYHGSLEKYYAAKRHIMAYMGADDLFIYNAHIPELQLWAKAATCQTLAIDATELIDMSKTHLIGEHNHVNALMASAAAMQVGVSSADCQKALDDFWPVRHRLQPVATINDVTYIDDAIASQPEAAIAGMTAVSAAIGPVGCLLLGGQDRDYDFGPLLQAAAQHNIPALVLFPDTIEKMKQALPPNYQPEILETRDMHEAVTWAAAHAPKNSVVLLSNGAPSYSLWKDFEEKGDLFQKTVHDLDIII